MKRQRPEQDLQRTVVQYLTILQRQRKCLFFHIPNGGARSKAEAAILKGQGVTAGVFDLCIVGRDIGFLELKAPGGAKGLSQSQAQFGKALSAFAVPWAMARRFEEAKAFIDQLCSYPPPG